MPSRPASARRDRCRRRGRRGRWALCAPRKPPAARRSASRSEDSNRAGATRRPAALAVASRPARPSTSTSVMTSPSACTRMRPASGRAVTTAVSVAEMPALVSSSARPSSAATSVERLTGEDAQPPDRVTRRSGQPRSRCRGLGHEHPRRHSAGRSRSCGDGIRRHIRPQQRTLDDDRDAGPGESAHVGSRHECRIGDDDTDGPGRHGRQGGADPSVVARHHDDRAVWEIDTASAQREFGQRLAIAACGSLDVDHRAPPISSDAASASVIA